MQKIKSLVSTTKTGLVLRILLGLFFMVSGVAKIIAPAEFGKIIYSYNIVPDSWVLILTFVIPYLEFLIDMALLINRYPGYVALIATVMLFVFTAVSGYRYFTGDVSDCGCFGKLFERKNDWTHKF